MIYPRTSFTSVEFQRIDCRIKRQAMGHQMASYGKFHYQLYVITVEDKQHVHFVARMLTTFQGTTSVTQATIVRTYVVLTTSSARLGQVMTGNATVHKRICIGRTPY